MTKQQIVDAATKSLAKGEDLQLWQAMEWMYEYGLVTYKEYTWFMRAQTEARHEGQETA